MSKQGDRREDKLQAAYEEGQKAFREYLNYSECPYTSQFDADLVQSWQDGWLDAEAVLHWRSVRR